MKNLKSRQFLPACFHSVTGKHIGNVFDFA